MSNRINISMKKSSKNGGDSVYLENILCSTFFFFGAQSTCYKKGLEREVDTGSNLGYLEVQAEKFELKW